MHLRNENIFFGYFKDESLLISIHFVYSLQIYTIFVYRHCKVFLPKITIKKCILQGLVRIQNCHIVRCCNVWWMQTGFRLFSYRRFIISVSLPFTYVPKLYILRQHTVKLYPLVSLQPWHLPACLRLQAKPGFILERYTVSNASANTFRET